MARLDTVLTGLIAAIGFTTAAVAQEATDRDSSKVQSTKTRADVRAETAGYVHSGAVTRFVDVANGPSLSRAQVQAEAREAQRLDRLGSGEGSVFITPAQAEQIRRAGLRAIGDQPLARGN